VKLGQGYLGSCTSSDPAPVFSDGSTDRPGETLTLQSSMTEDADAWELKSTDAFSTHAT
jgi:hypothetical protein